MDKDLEFRFSVSPVPEGEALTFAEIEERSLKELAKTERKWVQSLTNLAKIYSKTDRHDQASRCIERLIAVSTNPEDHAGYYLMLGCFMEQTRDYRRAAKFYRQALALEPCRKRTWYYIHNNLGYSLNQLADYDGAIPYLRRAIEIDPELPNAYKNLGLALEAKGHFAEAAGLYVKATQTDAADPRSLAHLEDLISSHPELENEVPDLRDRLEACREAVTIAKTRQPDWEAIWVRERQRQKPE